MIYTADKFGFYKVNDKKTYSKFEAFEWAKQNNSKIKWIYNDDIFSQHDWTVEPEIDLWELYKERARQIRNSYDYCVIWYSGGSDSHNILHAWLDAGCKIDEIATTWNYKTTGELYNHQNAEITHVVLPDIEKLKKSGYDFKFRLIEIPEISLKLFNVFSTNLEYLFNFNFQISSVGKQFLRDEIQDYKNLINQGKKVCFIWGKEKPYLFFENGKYYTHFADSIDDCVGPYSQNKYKEGWYDEMFYWTPDFPILPIKMAHVVKNFLKLNQDKKYYNEIDYNIVKNEPINNRPPNKNMTLKIEIIKSILYPKWLNKIYCNGKSPTRIFGLRDDWFVKSNIHELQKTKEALKNYLLTTNQNSKKSLMTFYSQKYWLEK